MSDSESKSLDNVILVPKEVAQRLNSALKQMSADELLDFIHNNEQLMERADRILLEAAEGYNEATQPFQSLQRRCIDALIFNWHDEPAGKPQKIQL
jgi:N-acetylmuramic acid 6-phosphate (MurNAc-6-P) etherase